MRSDARKRKTEQSTGRGSGHVHDEIPADALEAFKAVWGRGEPGSRSRAGFAAALPFLVADITAERDAALAERDRLTEGVRALITDIEGYRFNPKKLRALLDGEGES